MIIKDKCDNDLYKFTMGNAVYNLFPDALAEYRFKCRSKGVKLARYAEAIDREITEYCGLALKQEEYDFLQGLGFISTPYLDFLKNHRSRRENIILDTEGDELLLTIKGPWVQTILDEVPLLAIISQVYMAGEFGAEPMALAMEQLKKKCVEEPGIAFADFGTRRRYSLEIHREVVRYLAERYGAGTGKTQFTGTSNVSLAREFGLKPIGTMAHEWLQAGQALTHPRYGQRFMLDNWLRVFKGDLGIALTDVIGIDTFLADFDASLSKAFDGVRHDSGSPYEFTEKMIAHYKGLGIDPLTKSVIYSDGLDFAAARDLKEQFGHRIRCAFGIGTNLTNDIPGAKALQIVIKLVSLNGLPVAKISDSPGKGMCRDERYVEFLKSLF